MASADPALQADAVLNRGPHRVVDGSVRGLERSNPATLGGLDGIGERLVVMSIGRALPLTLGFFLDTRTAPRVRYLSSEDCLG
jgi:hypothetical protein